MEITAIKIEPNDDSEGKVRATAEVILNDSLSLRGIKIMRGRYGLFLAFPSFQAGSPHRVFDALSLRLRKDMQTRILKAYQTALATPMPLFG